MSQICVTHSCFTPYASHWAAPGFFLGGGGGGHFEMLDNTYGIISLSSFTVCASNKSLKTLNLVCKVIIQTRLCCSWKSGFHLIVLGTFAFSLVLHYVVTRLPYKTKTRNICSVRNETKTNRVFPRFASDTCIKKKEKIVISQNVYFGFSSALSSISVACKI